ncbi:MAG TPA: DUF5134 domain-containing protein [Streptosporangiaceae bacterium]|nr:DUF5134 domain-containing protein [Streptosporangiaceae bacterium]
MIESMMARWLLTAVFMAAALCARPMRKADRPAAAFCVAMCAAMIVMAWRAEPGIATWVQVAGFGCAALWFVLAGRTGAGRLGRPAPDDMHHALMAAAMIWMLTVLSGGTQMRSAMLGHGAMAGMSGVASLPFPVLAVTGLGAAYCVIASIPWLGRAVGPGPRVTDPAAAGQAMMSVGMAAMLIAML